MNELEVWRLIVKKLSEGENCTLLLVTESTGSSPGRQGFKMAVSMAGEMKGSIGGGIMEHKLVELAKIRMVENKLDYRIKKQIHRKDVPDHQSGMICSGEQWIASCPMQIKDLEKASSVVQILEKKEKATLKFNQKGWEVIPGIPYENLFEFSFKDESKWSYIENLGYKHKVYIVGGGHVGYAMSRIMKMLDFHVTVLDARENLNTLEKNIYADEKVICEYNELANYIPEGKNHYVVIMTFGYRDDNIALRHIIQKKYRYLGMMGSEEKVKKLFGDMISDGFSESDIERVQSPIGLQIKSRTPEEIAISVAAEIIREKNKNLP